MILESIKTISFGVFAFGLLPIILFYLVPQIVFPLDIIFGVIFVSLNLISIVYFINGIETSFNGDKKK